MLPYPMGLFLCLPSVQPTVVTNREINISLLSIFGFKDNESYFGILNWNRLFSVLTQRDDLELLTV